MLKAKISELKSRLSAYLARVRAGESVLVLDRATPVARLVPLDGQGDLVVREPVAPAASLRKRRSPIELRKPVDVDAILADDRDQR